jgi:predicted dinucleotide-binding enzyme
MTRKKQSLKFAVIGAGMVGTAIGFLLRKAGHDITAMADLSAAHLKRAQSYTGAVCFRHPAQAADHADCLLISTPDDRIGSV